LKSNIIGLLKAFVSAALNATGSMLTVNNVEEKSFPKKLNG
jgi:hypothetical protein